MVLSLARSCGFALVARSQQLLRVANRAPCPVTRLSATSAFGPRSCSSPVDSRVSVLAISEMTSRVCSQHAVLAARAAVPYVEPNALVAPILSPRPRPAQSDAAEQRCVTELCQRGALGSLRRRGAARTTVSPTWSRCPFSCSSAFTVGANSSADGQPRSPWPRRAMHRAELDCTEQRRALAPPR